MARAPSLAGVPGTSAPPREGVLRDYPLRLWARQQQHTEEMLREFQLLVHGQRSGQGSTAPARLLQVVESLLAAHGPRIDRIQEERQRAVDQGLERMDSRVPLVEGTPELLGMIQQALADVDDFCRAGDLLTLARPPELVALMDWTARELVAQYHGAAPTPWPGPF